jgi:lipopolysaccharide transport system ATP-binding protein
MIVLEGVTKIFRLPHDRRATLRQRFIGLLQRQTYEELYALWDINLKVNDGEFLGIIGKNGAGKSTLLKVIARVLEPTSGKVSVNGNIAPFLELGVGFQWELTVKDNIFFYGALLGMSRREIEQKYDWIIDFSGLDRFIDAKLKNLSSGMQVRLGFSITVGCDYPILLVDEVLAVGDIDFQQKCYSSFKNFKQQGRTIVFVSHDLKAIGRFCDRVVLLENGQIKCGGKPEQVLATYMYGGEHLNIHDADSAKIRCCSNRRIANNINTKEYWDKRFREDWELFDGPKQTEFFYKLAIKNLPRRVSRTIKKENLSILDWGCAEGDGTNLLFKKFGGTKNRVEGFDISDVAIEKAKTKYPYIGFRTILSENLEGQFDVIFTSNTLEHFKKPLAMLQQLLMHTRYYLIGLVPFQERNPIAEHFCVFDYSSFPPKIGNLVLVYFKVIDVASKYWSGRQALFIYMQANEERIC